MKEIKSFLGKGWSFPPTFNAVDGSVDMVSEDADIRQSLEIILFTSLGERIMRPNFGSRLQDTVFGTIDSVTINKMKSTIKDAVLNFEPRVILNTIQINESKAVDGRLEIDLDLTIRTINVRTNIVFPFYFKEGTNVVGM